MFISFFFFQAEDGIRDVAVTGVQTCALPISEEQGHRGRREMLGTSFRDYERQIREQFSDMFAHAGLNTGRDIAGIILNRWGHAYLSPQPGFFFGRDGRPAPREILRRAPFGRIAFANTDLRSEEHTSELQSRLHLVCRLLLEKKKYATSAPRSNEPTSTLPSPYRL